MNGRFAGLLALGLAASLANILGGWIVTSRTELRRNVMNVFLSVGAGFMLSAAILEVIPHSLGLNQSAGLIVLGGYLFVHLVEHTVATHFHFGEETHPDQVLNPVRSYSALAGLVLHAYFDGALIAAGFWISTRFGVLMFLAIVLHKVPEGFTAASIMRASKRRGGEVVFATLGISVSTLAGVLSIGLSRNFAATALPFSAGVTLYVAASDLIPEVNKESRGTVSVGVFLGVIFFFLSETLLSMFL